MSMLTFPLHPHGQALLVTAVLAAVPLSFVHSAVFIVPTGIGQILAHCPLKEAFTALTAVNAIVLAWSMWQKGKEGKVRPVRKWPDCFQGDIRIVWRVPSHQRICLHRCNKGVSEKASVPGCGTTAASSRAEVSHRQSCSLHEALT